MAADAEDTSWRDEIDDDSMMVYAIEAARHHMQRGFDAGHQEGVAAGVAEGRAEGRAALLELASTLVDAATLSELEQIADLNSGAAELERAGRTPPDGGRGEGWQGDDGDVVEVEVASSESGLTLRIRASRVGGPFGEVAKW